MGDLGRSPADAAVEKALGEMRTLLAQGDLVEAWTVIGRLADRGPLGGDVGGVAFELGRRLLKQREEGLAQEAFRAAYASGEPRVSAPAAIRLGQAAQRVGDLGGARAYFEHAVEWGSDSRVAVAAFHLGVLAQAEDSADAESWYLRALQFTDDSGVAAGAAANLGAIRHAAGDIDSARALFQQALEKADEKTATDYAYGIGDLLRRRGALADAEPMLRRAIAAGHPQARLALARLLFADGKLDQAETVLREAVDNGGDMAVLVALGDVLVRRVDPGADLVRFIGHASADFAHEYVGHLPSGPEIAEAEQCYRRAVAAGEHSALVPLGHLLTGTNRIAEAERVLRAAVQVEAVDARAALAALLHLRGEDEEASRILEPAVAADNLRALILQADLHGHRDDGHAEAVEMLRRALRVGGATLGAGGMLFTHLALLADLHAAEATLQQMLATNDETGLGLLASFVSDDTALADALRQARDTNDEAEVRDFTALAVRCCAGRCRAPTGQ
jgi:tetratricopeptide (TPR) repeat protein